MTDGDDDAPEEQADAEAPENGAEEQAESAPAEAEQDESELGESESAEATSDESEAADADSGAEESDAADADGADESAESEAADESEGDADDESGDADAESEDEVAGGPTAEDLDERLDAVESDLEAAETEADLGGVEADLDEIERDLEAADLPEPDEDEEDEEEAEDPREELESRLSDLRSSLEEQRGPYKEDVVADIDEAQTTVEDTRWTEQGRGEVSEAVQTFVERVGEVLDESFSVDYDDESSLVEALESVKNTVDARVLDPDDDADTIAALLEATEELQSNLEDAQEWDDLEVREKLRYEGFYDVLGHYKDFPPEWSALKEHEQRGNVEMVLLALDHFTSDFMEEHCLEALTRMGDTRAFDAMHQRAQKRDKPGVRALGKMGAGAEGAVETLIEYVDADKDPALQKVTFKALGEIGHLDAVQPLADKLEMDNDNVRPDAARALGLIGDTRAVKPLRDSLQTDAHPNTRAAAAWALRQIGTQEALEAVADHEDDHFLVQSEVEKATSALSETRAPA